ncbi:MAG: dihydrofolate reductase family protein [Streptosporangiaceae bacterium]|jgi:dihydrofolate reductase
MTRIVSGLAVSLDGYIAGPDDSREQPLGRGGNRLFEWYFNGDTPSRLYPSFRLSQPSAEFFDEYASRFGAIIAGRHTYDVVDAWSGHGPLPGAALFVLGPSTTPATRNSPGPRSASSSTPPPQLRHAATGTSNDQLDKDHPHNADERTWLARECVLWSPAGRA